MGTTATVQMNTRIEKDLKQEGDRILAGLGYSPSQAVRGTWEYVVKNREHPERIANLIEGERIERPDAVIKNRLDALTRGRKLCFELGPLPQDIAQESYEALREAMYTQRYKESL